MKIFNKINNIIQIFTRTTKPVNTDKVDLCSTVLCGKQLEEYYKGVTFGINTAIENPGFIKIGKNSKLLHNTDIHAIRNYYAEYKPSIEIGEGTQIGPYNSIASINKILIGNNVLFGPHIHITDHSHAYQDITKPIMHQPAFSKGPIIIEDDCWLGFGCHILSGVSIGKHTVIGANSVVTNDIPSFSVAVGIPAKIIKTFDFETREWKSVNL
jgi:acetyltransferase-like isoleucine patch superfamily enzyme